MRVLYVDDDRINALLFEETVRFAPGVDVQTAASGDEALELVARWTPDLLVVDLHLPDANGLSLLPRLRAAASNPALPAFLCTADDAADTRSAALAAGFEAVWCKPVELPMVIAELQRRSSPA
jgi:two-component system, OmpR family, response regulator